MDALVQWSTGNAWLHPVSVDATAAIHHEITESTTVQPEEEGKRTIQHWYDHNGEIHSREKGTTESRWIPDAPHYFRLPFQRRPGETKLK